MVVGLMALVGLAALITSPFRQVSDDDVADNAPSAGLMRKIDKKIKKN